MSYQGDYKAGATLRFFFNTRDSTGAPASLGGSPAQIVCENPNASPNRTGAGVSWTFNYNGNTGLNRVTVNTGADPGFYADGSQITVLLDDGVVAGISVAGAIVASFSLGLVSANATKIASDSTAATNLAQGAEGLVLSSVASGATTTIIPTNLTEATNDHYNGRYITFTSGALLGQSSDITDYFGAGKELTVTALTEAPNQGDTFVIS